MTRESEPAAKSITPENWEREKAEHAKDVEHAVARRASPETRASPVGPPAT